MISRIQGRLVAKSLDRVEVATESGVAYELAIPLGTFESLPDLGEAVTLHAHLVVREDEWSLYGFAKPLERRVFRRLLGATGVGPALALGIISALSADRVVRAIRERDAATLQTVPRVGRKKAEQLILDLAEKVADLEEGEEMPGARPAAPSADDAVRALVSLGYTQAEALKAVRSALDGLGRSPDVPELIRAALAVMTRR